MKNSIDARVAFSFKGETYAPSASIDLDAHMQASGSLPDIHPLLAHANAIDTYSYLYEVMEAHEIEFANPSGLAAACFADGVFDIPCFEQLWREASERAVLHDIARQQLGVDDLEANPDLKAALLGAFEAGKASR